jgi:hypothetical protein
VAKFNLPQSVVEGFARYLQHIVQKEGLDEEIQQKIVYYGDADACIVEFKTNTARPLKSNLNISNPVDGQNPDIQDGDDSADLEQSLVQVEGAKSVEIIFQRKNVLTIGYLSKAVGWFNRWTSGTKTRDVCSKRYFMWFLI